jgi:PilZ domain-containing protein
MRSVTADLYEKRWIPRHHMIVPIHCQLSGKDESGSGWVKDFSSIGASVITNLLLTPGDELTLTLPNDGRPEMRIAATVRWNQGQLFGVEFKHTPRN